MEDESVARRYAAALFSKAVKENAVDAVRDDLGKIMHEINTMSALRVVLAEPTIVESRKSELLTKAFQGSIGQGTLAFLQMLTAKRRIGLISAVNDEFIRMTREYQSVASAEAVTAVPLTDEEKTALTAKLAAMTGKSIELTTALDATLLGGVLVRIGDTVYDGTVRGNLNRLRERLLAQN